jgi:lipopolysaccharide/colanic/teichoic acid biosynthesis glycosyltransferase
VLFRQERVGLAGKPFSMLKFRSMCMESEKDGARFAAADDDRVTRLGRFIRKCRIDELPQMWNVLRGDMSVIGPRPEQASFVQQFEGEIPFYAYRHAVRPGISGWAQVTQGYAAGTVDTRVKLEHDFYYIKHVSLWLDLLVVVRTVRVILTGFGSR